PIRVSRCECQETIPEVAVSDAWHCDFSGIFVRLWTRVLKRPVVRVEALMHSQAVRSLCRDGTRAAFVHSHRTSTKRNDPPMKKLFHSLTLLCAVGALGTLAGCELYFGGHNDGGSWSYCGSDGQYQCQGDNCTWVSPTCTDSGSNSGGGTGSNGS